MFCKIGLFKILQVSQKSTCVRVSANQEACNFIKIKLQHRWFLGKLEKFLRAPTTQSQVLRIFTFLYIKFQIRISHAIYQDIFFYSNIYWSIGNDIISKFKMFEFIIFWKLFLLKSTKHNLKNCLYLRVPGFIFVDFFKWLLVWCKIQAFIFRENGILFRETFWYS